MKMSDYDKNRANNRWKKEHTKLFAVRLPIEDGQAFSDLLYSRGLSGNQGLRRLIYAAMACPSLLDADTDAETITTTPESDD